MMRSLQVRAKKVCRPPEHELTHKSARRSLSARRPTEPMHQIAWVIWDCQALTMLCATVLAELEAAVPAEKRIIPPCGDVASVDSDASSTDSSAQDTGSSTILASTISASTVSTASDGSNARVGAPRDFSGHADGTSNAYNSVEKWIVAALSKLGQEKADLLLPSLEPNDTLCSQLHSTIAEWHEILCAQRFGLSRKERDVATVSNHVLKECASKGTVVTCHRPLINSPSRDSLLRSAPI